MKMSIEIPDKTAFFEQFMSGRVAKLKEPFHVVIIGGYGSGTTHVASYLHDLLVKGAPGKKMVKLENMDGREGDGSVILIEDKPSYGYAWRKSRHDVINMIARKAKWVIIEVLQESRIDALPSDIDLLIFLKCNNDHFPSVLNYLGRGQAFYRMIGHVSLQYPRDNNGAIQVPVSLSSVAAPLESRQAWLTGDDTLAF